MFKKIISKTGKACFDFKMINEGDRILLCFSGGKDSLVLLKVFNHLKNKYPINFEIKALCVNPNFDENYLKNIKKILIKENIEFEIINTDINNVIIKQNNVKRISPCFMCSRLRRGIIYKYALENKFNKIALGHTLDDAIETHLINLFFSNKTSFLKPKYLADNGKIEIIRPLIYVDENLILEYIKKYDYIPVKNNCPIKKENSKREYFKKIIKELEKINPRIKESAYHAFKNTKELNSWDIKKN